MSISLKQTIPARLILHTANKVRLSGFILVTGTQDTKRNPLCLGLGAAFQWQTHFTTSTHRMYKIMETVLKDICFVINMELGSHLPVIQLVYFLE